MIQDVKLASDLKSIALCCDKPSAMQLNNTSELYVSKKRIASLHFVRLLS
jgi:hypothetical protein